MLTAVAAVTATIRTLLCCTLFLLNRMDDLVYDTFSRPQLKGVAPAGVSDHADAEGVNVLMRLTLKHTHTLLHPPHWPSFVHPLHVPCHIPFGFVSLAHVVQVTQWRFSFCVSFCQEGLWLWSDGSRFYYTSWSPGQPDNNGGAEHCIDMNFGGTVTTIYWNVFAVMKILNPL